MSKPEMPAEISRIDAPYRASGIGDIEIVPGAGAMFRTMPQIVEWAKLMAKADIYLPPHARNRVEICFAILMECEQWKLKNPFFVAQHSYVVSQKQMIGGQWQIVERAAYDSAIFQAALLASGAIVGRPQYEYEGEGPERTCTVSVMTETAGGRMWERYTTPPLRQCHPGHIEKDGKKFVRGSPLWDVNPDVQLGYYGLRCLVRLKFQDVLAGFYDKDEFDEMPPAPEANSSPNLMERLPGRMEGAGFHAEVPAAVGNGNTSEGARRKRGRPRKKAAIPVVSPAIAEPSSNGAPSAARQPPGTQEEYIRHANEHIDAAANPSELADWFYSAGEVDLRASCGVGSTAMQLLESIITDKVAIANWKEK